CCLLVVSHARLTVACLLPGCVMFTWRAGACMAGEWCHKPCRARVEIPDPAPIYAGCRERSTISSVSQDMVNFFARSQYESIRYASDFRNPGLSGRGQATAALDDSFALQQSRNFPA